MKTKAFLLALFLVLPAMLRADDAAVLAAVKNDLSWRDAHPIADINYVVTENSADHTYMYRITRVGATKMRHVLLRVDTRPSGEDESLKFGRKWNVYDIPNAKPTAFRTWINYENPLKLVAEGTLSQEKSDGDTISYSFKCVTSVAGSEPATLLGNLTFDRKKGFITEVDIYSNGAIQTERGRVDSLSMHIYYDLNRKLGFVVPTSVNWSVKGEKADDCDLSFGDYRKGN